MFHRPLLVFPKGIDCDASQHGAGRLPRALFSLNCPLILQTGWLVCSLEKLFVLLDREPLFVPRLIFQTLRSQSPKNSFHWSLGQDKSILDHYNNFYSASQMFSLSFGPPKANGTTFIGFCPTPELCVFDSYFWNRNTLKRPGLESNLMLSSPFMSICF